MSAEARFMSKTMPEPNSGCWLWIGSTRKDGYGRFSLRDSKPILAHRASYELFCEAPANDMKVCHKCDNPSCVNPDHLFIGTQRDNVIDAVSKGKFFGRNHCIGNGKLTADQAKEIKISTKPQKDLAAQFNVSISSIQKIKYGKFWNWV